MNVECISTVKGRPRGRVFVRVNRKNWSNLTFGFSHLFRAQNVLFFLSLRISRMSRIIKSIFRFSSRQLFYTSLEHLLSTLCAHNAVVFITGNFPRVKSIRGGPAARCFE